MERELYFLLSFAKILHSFFVHNSYVKYLQGPTEVDFLQLLYKYLHL